MGGEISLPVMSYVCFILVCNFSCWLSMETDYFQVNTGRQSNSLQMQGGTSGPLQFTNLMQCIFIFFFPCSYLGGLILFYRADVYDDSTVQCLWSSRCCLSLHGPV